MICLTFIETYQTLIVGAVGFAGVVITLLVNANTLHKQERGKRDHERDSLRTALSQELKINRASLTENLDALRQDSANDYDLLVPTKLMNDVFVAFVPRIGLLPDREVGVVMNAYLTLEAFNAKLFVVGVTIENSPRHVRIPKKNVQLFAGMLETILPSIDRALESLEYVSKVGIAHRA